MRHIHGQHVRPVMTVPTAIDHRRTACSEYTQLPMYSYRYPFLYLLLLTFLPFCASAQVWQADFSTEGTPTEKHWRYDRELYHIAGGALHLSVPKEPPRGSATLATDIIVPATRGIQQGRTADKWTPKRTKYEFCGMAIASPDLHSP